MSPPFGKDEPIGKLPTRDELLAAARGLVEVGREIPAIGAALEVIERAASWQPPFGPTNMARVWCAASMTIENIVPGQLLMVEKPANMVLFVDTPRVVAILEIAHELAQTWRFTNHKLLDELIADLVRAVGNDPINANVIR